jgi:hypothetical protein
MMKHTAIAAILSLGLIVPAAAAQAVNGNDGPVKHLVRQKVVRSTARRIRQGVRAGQITPTELAKLRADARALRTQLKALRQSGTKLTRDQRVALRLQLRGLARDIRRARHK